MNEINFKTADFDDITEFAKNLLLLDGRDDNSYHAKIAYYPAVAQVILGRKAAESAAALAQSINAASTASTTAAALALADSRRMVRATWALVVVTAFLSLATAGLVFYTRELVRVEHPITLTPSQQD
jgi:hypothetical protein